MTRYVCVHGHFYQPPREHPWLEEVEQQDAAYPFHDWNERITAECYRPNARARVLDDQGCITRLVNTYGYLSFDVGPTLLSWMADADPATYAAILEGDRLSARRYGGHGSAMAQAHSHAILPLAAERDRRTEIRWGAVDFRHRFGRDPRGMWLPETAVDEPTLDLLAAEGIAFTVLSPSQAARTRPIGEVAWTDVGDGGVDTTRPYRVALPSGRTIAVFFYDGAIARAVAFERLLDSSEAFEQRLLQGFGDRDEPQLVHLATDGESYGHHHRHGEMALAAAFERLEARGDVQLTNYAQFLALHPPTHEAEVVQASSWSCAHGVERWRADCGCGRGDGDHQRWRAPLRTTLERVRDHLDARFDAQASDLLTDPWAARDDYHRVVLDRRGNLPAFLAEHAVRDLDEREIEQALRLLEMQRHALLMFTSCGWFFEDVARLEPVQVLRYAARAVQLAGLLGETADLEAVLRDGLAAAPGNDPDLPDGWTVYQHLVAPTVTTLPQVAAHAVIADLVAGTGAAEGIGAYRVAEESLRRRRAGRAGLVHGHVTIRSEVTHAVLDAEVAAVHLGDHNVVCGVRRRHEQTDVDAASAAFVAALKQAFDTAEFPEVIRVIDARFGDRRYTLRSLFRDARRDALDGVLAGVVGELEGTYQAIYRGRAPLLRFLADVGATVPGALRAPATLVLNAELRRQLADPEVDPETVAGLLAEARRLGVELDDEGLAYALSATIAGLARRTAARLADADGHAAPFEAEQAAVLARATRLLRVVEQVPFEVDLAPAQDVVWQTLQLHHQGLGRRAAAGDEPAARWRDELEHVAAGIGVALPRPDPEEQP